MYPSLWMFWVMIALLLVAGLLAASSLIVARSPNAAQAFKALGPAQGAIGLAALVWGIIVLIKIITGMGGFVTLMLILGIVLLIVLGGLLAYGLLQTYVLQGNAQARGAEIQAKLAKNQVAYGVAAVIVAVVLFILMV